MVRAMSEQIHDSILDTTGHTPMVRLSRIGKGLAVRAARQVRVHEPGRLGQGSHRRPDAARRRARGPHQAGRHADRADERQHRHRHRDGGGRARLPRDHHDAREDVAGEAGGARGARRRDHPHADRGRVGLAREPHRRRAPAQGSDPELAHPRPVLEPVEPGRARGGHRRARSSISAAASSTRS